MRCNSEIYKKTKEKPTKVDGVGYVLLGHLKIDFFSDKGEKIKPSYSFAKIEGENIETRSKVEKGFIHPVTIFKTKLEAK